MNYSIVALFPDGELSFGPYKKMHQALKEANAIKKDAARGKFKEFPTLIYIHDRDGSLRYRWDLFPTYRQTYPR